MSPGETRIMEQLPAVIDALESEDFCGELLAFINYVVPFDSGVIMAYPEGAELIVLHEALHAGDKPGFNGPYREGLWLLSPLYLSAKSGVRGYFHILDIAPDNFSESDYYALYYRSNGVLDHSGFLVETGDGTPLALSLERTPAMHPYTRNERSTLRQLTGIVAALVRRHWPGTVSAGAAGRMDLHEQVQGLLEQFGSKRLTRRERDVTQLILRGLSSKAVARALGISSQTEQVHRKNIYNKLGLSSHNELFSLFFDALAQPLAPGCDPLEELLPPN